jgi:hypothetical protein
MLIELITPLVLATAPMTITVPETQYSHKAQAADIGVLHQRQPTWSGTQTFTAAGRPFDSDND